MDDVTPVPITNEHRASVARRVENELAALPSISGAELASLFGDASRPTPYRRPLTYALQKGLLRRTLRHATTHCGYYRGVAAYDQWAESDAESPPDLTPYPIVTRALMTAAPHDFKADDVQLRSICHTSGTTGNPLEIAKSFEESSFLMEYYTEVFDPVLRRLTNLPLSLSFPNFYHGTPVSLPGIGFGFASGVTDDTLIRDAKRVLDAQHSIPGHESRVSTVSGLEHHLIFFTHFLLEQGVDPQSYKLAGLTSTGGFLSRARRKFLEQSWGCPLYDRFTLTETIGGAGRFKGTDVFLMDSHIIAEAVDLDTGQPLESGVGALVITNLHPFVQMQPLIRYQTGDVIRRVSHPSAVFAFEFLGRLNNAISQKTAAGRQWLLFPVDLQEVLTTLPDIRQHEWFSNVKLVHDRAVGSLPIVSVAAAHGADGHAAIMISVELRYSPHCFAERADEVKDTIVKRLTRPGSGLAQAIERGTASLEVKLYGPNSLNAPLVVKI